MRSSILVLMLVACGSTQEPAAGVSTAPQSVPHAEAGAPALASAATSPVAAPTASTAQPSEVLPPPSLGRLHAITGMATRGKKLDAHAVIGRIEAQPTVLDACSVVASAEPNAPDGSWNVKVAITRGKAALEVQSATEPAFTTCLHDAAGKWSFAGLPDGELMVLLGLAQ